MSPNIIISEDVWSQAQLEIHLARNALTSALLKAQLYAREHPADTGAQALADVLLELKERTEAALLRALREHKPPEVAAAETSS